MIDVETVIGVITYNRPFLLRSCVESIYRAGKSNAQIYVSDDGSNSETLDFLDEENKKENLIFTSNQRGGVARNSNRVLNFFINETNAQYLFLLNDDIQIVKSDPTCFDIYIEASNRTKIEHFSYLDKYASHKVFNWRHVNGYTIKESKVGDGCFMFFTRKAIETLGGFDFNFGIYGCEHSDMTRRASFAGFLTDKNVVNDIEIEPSLVYVPQYRSKIERSLSPKERNKALNKSATLWNETRTLPPVIWKPRI